MSGTIPPASGASRDQVEPGQPIDEEKLRRLKLTMGVMSGFLVLTFMVVVAAFVWRLTGGAPAGEAPRAAHPAGYFGMSRIAIAPGEAVRSVTLGEGRLAIHVAGDNGEAVILVDPKSGAELGRILLSPMSDYAAR
ncbi:MAG: hypothetical protein C0454_10005 [Parvibaculum sp.]|jgi:hypothetical protein|nr:hypothetical protein [Parvibaculum sp.]